MQSSSNLSDITLYKKRIYNLVGILGIILLISIISPELEQKLDFAYKLGLFFLVATYVVFDQKQKSVLSDRLTVFESRQNIINKQLAGKVKDV